MLILKKKNFLNTAFACFKNCFCHIHPRSDWQISVLRPSPTGSLQHMAATSFLKSSLLCSSFLLLCFPLLLPGSPRPPVCDWHFRGVSGVAPSPVYHLPESRPLDLPPEQFCQPPHWLPALQALPAQTIHYLTYRAIFWRMRTRLCHFNVQILNESFLKLFISHTNCGLIYSWLSRFIFMSSSSQDTTVFGVWLKLLTHSQFLACRDHVSVTLSS